MRTSKKRRGIEGRARAEIGEQSTFHKSSTTFAEAHPKTSDCLLACAGMVAFVFPRTVERRLRAIALAVSSSVYAIAGAGRQVNETSKQLAGISSEQAASLEQINANMEQIGSSARRHTNSALVVQIIGTEAADAAKVGGEGIRAMEQTLANLRASTAAQRAAMCQLLQHS